MIVATPQRREAEPPEYPRTLRGVHRAARDSGSIAFTAPSLLFLLYIIIPAWGALPLWQALAVTALCLPYSVLFVYTTGARSYPVRDRLLWLGASWVVVALIGLIIGVDILYMVMFVQVMHAILVPLRGARVVVPLLGLVVVVIAVLHEQPIAIVLALVGLVFALSLAEGVEREILKDRLDAAERRSATLAVAAERERIGRDLHDILGHSLTTITVSAQLAQRLLESDPDAARTQLAEIERISRQSLADVRTTASGMQQVRAATEIASARSVLLAAGIEADVPAALPSLDDERSELFGYVLREGVTNVVRHSRATRATLRVTEEEVEVADDGVGIPAGRSRTGLAGLEARVAEAGGTLTVDTGPDGTRLIARLEEGTP